jgi:hypothetical protein
MIFRTDSNEVLQNIYQNKVTKQQNHWQEILKFTKGYLCIHQSIFHAKKWLLPEDELQQKNG